MNMPKTSTVILGHCARTKVQLMFITDPAVTNTTHWTDICCGRDYGDTYANGLPTVDVTLPFTS